MTAVALAAAASAALAQGMEEPPVPEAALIDELLRLFAPPPSLEELPFPGLVVTDQPSDSGGDVVVNLYWPEGEAGRKIERAELWRAAVEGRTPVLEDFEPVESLLPLRDTTLRHAIGPRRAYFFVRVYRGEQYRDTPVVGPVFAPASWFNLGRLNLFIAAIVISGLIIAFIRLAAQGRPLFIRRIRSLDAIDEAVGRASEMGKKILFVPGIMDVDDPQTIAGLTILGRVARVAATQQSEIDVPTARSMVMVAGREAVREAFLASGRPEDYREEIVHYITDDQFGYAAAVGGLMLRDRPAAIFYQGAFFAESLLLAETGHGVGAIQIAGTAAVAQLPFFIAACDYTLIGEELFAASAYLSKEPRLLGSLKGQDYGKLTAAAALIFGILAATAGQIAGHPEWTDAVRSLFTVMD
ncbi:MAG: hypothetical protein C4523_09900 [Myxococcales bacterium]|nr:MAG: hypothetical protein C4523_09900 [Myxococcales bacterium]